MKGSGQYNAKPGLNAVRQLSVLPAVFAVLVVLFVPVPVLAQSGYERIESFSSDIEVREDGFVTITETIEYYFPSARHGIFRDIPTVYEDESGGRTYVPIEVIGVWKDDGTAWQYKVNKEKYGIEVKMGDSDRTITGLHTYVIQYEAEGVVRYFEDHDELYWNVTGSDWTVPIHRIAATVTLPEGIGRDEIRTRCFTGEYGSTAEDCLSNVQGSSVHFAASEPLTVVVGWPAGRVAKLVVSAPVPYRDCWPFLIPIAVFLYLLRLWWTSGRDTGGRKTLVVQYEPPEGARPGDVGVLMDETAHIHDITATIVDLAVRGYLKIVEYEKPSLIFGKKTDFQFVRIKDFLKDETLKPYEKEILEVMFGGSGKSVTLSGLKDSHAFHSSLRKIKSQLYREAIRLGYFKVNPDRVRTVYIGIGVAVIITAAVIFGAVKFNTALAVALTGLVFVGFSHLMPKKTVKGTLAAEHAAGFREYLDKAEKCRIQWQEKERIFEKFLPYAMVYEVADHWTKAFAGLDVPSPDWYEGSALSDKGFNALMLTKSMGSFGSSMGKAIRSAPQQSSGGSGFSGGGFGGGGGGSW